MQVLAASYGGLRMDTVEMPQYDSVTPAIGPSLDRWMFHLAWAVGVALFLMVGGAVLLPADSEAALSLLTHDRPGLMLAEMLGLAVVAAALATAIAGKRHSDVGTFTAALGVGLLSLRAGNMTSILMDHADDRLIALRLLVDAGAWCLIVVVSATVDRVVARWLFGRCDDRCLAAHWPIFGRVAVAHDEPACPPFAYIRHLGIGTLVALALIALFSTGRGERAIQQGQACFAVVAGFYLAAGRAFKAAPVPALGASWLIVPIVCAIALLYSFVRSLTSPVLVNGLPTVPVTNFLQILPVTYMMFGTAAVLLGRWRVEAQHRIEDLRKGNAGRPTPAGRLGQERVSKRKTNGLGD